MEHDSNIKNRWQVSRAGASVRLCVIAMRNTANKIRTDNDGEKANPSVVETHRAAAIARVRSIMVSSCLTSVGTKIMPSRSSL